MRLQYTALALFAGAALIPSASAARLVGLQDDGDGTYSLGEFNSTDTAAPNLVPITNLAVGETLQAIDFAPRFNAYYAIGSGTNVYTIDRATGVATSLAGYSQAVPGTNFGFDFNPAFMGGQFARIISNTDDNRVISGNDGSYLAPIEKTDVFYDTGDANEGATPTIAHIAYTNSIPGATATQQYGIDYTLDVLVTVANNAGTLGTVGSLGIDATELGGFDISGEDGVAYALFTDGLGSSSLSSVDLGSGAATSLRTVPGNFIGVTAVPEPSSTLLIGLAGLGLVARRKR